MAPSPQVQATKIKAVEAVLVALLAGLFGLAGSYIQLKLAKPATLGEVKSEVASQVPEQVVQAFDKGLPVGTVIASMVEPKEFAKISGDPPGFNPEKSKWYPADGRDAPGSKWAEVKGVRVPDLRGVFLRGLDYTDIDRILESNSPQRDPDANRTPGSLQLHQFQSHGHMHPTELKSEKWYGDGAKLRGITETPFGPLEPVALTHGVKVQHGPETRPTNIAVFYYVKIN